jgi:hypothetical protein
MGNLFLPLAHDRWVQKSCYSIVLINEPTNKKEQSQGRKMARKMKRKKKNES